MSEEKKGNGHRPAGLEELQKSSDDELIESIGGEEPDVRHLSEAELQRRLNRKVSKLNRRFWLMTGLLFMMNVAMLGVAWVLLKPRIDEDEVYEQARDLLDQARHYAGRGVEQASVLGAVAAERGGRYADVASEIGGRYADVAFERGHHLADVAAERGSKYAHVGMEKAGKTVASIR